MSFDSHVHAVDELAEQSSADAPRPIGLAFIAGVLAGAAGFVSIALAWYHSGNTDEVWVQNQELLSGGVGGLALVVLGTGLLIRDRLQQRDAVVIQYLARLSGALADRTQVPNAVAEAEAGANGARTRRQRPLVARSPSVARRSK